MGTYKEIQAHIKQKHDCSVETCWIAHVKELVGLAPRKAHNRISENDRKNPCPSEKRPLIEGALRYFEMI